MAVESRFVVIRHGVEVETFMDKKSADEYDKMLDIADNLAEFLESAPCKLDEKMTEELSIYLAKNRDDVLVALQAKKAKSAPKKPAKTEAPVIEKTEPVASNDEAPESKVVAEETVSDEAEKPKKTTRRRTKAKEDVA